MARPRLKRTLDAVRLSIDTGPGNIRMLSRRFTEFRLVIMLAGCNHDFAR